MSRYLSAKHSLEEVYELEPDADLLKIIDQLHEEWKKGVLEKEALEKLSSQDDNEP